MESVTTQSRPTFETVRSTGGGARLALAGSWTTTSGRQPDIQGVFAEVTTAGAAGEISFDLEKVTQWDSSLLAWLMDLVLKSEETKVRFDQATLPDGVRDTLQLALAVPEQRDAAREVESMSLLERVGNSAIGYWRSLCNVSEFVGECVLALGRVLRGRAQFRRSDFMLFIQEAGAEALWISVMISFLVGLILAFVGAVQLQQFGASIYVASLVGIAMVREMGCIMTGIIMSGRTGASYAAQLGTMKVNQEIDAYRTFQFSPIDFLVMPRMLALFLMMPLLTTFASLAGIIGGALIGVFMLDLTLLDYWNQTVSSLTWAHCSAGFIKSFVFGLIVAVSGCYNGMRCENNAAGVGRATTSAVVSGIMVIVVADAIFALIFNIFGI